MSFNENTNGLIDHDEKEINLRERLFIYIKHWKWFVVSLIVFLALGYIYIKVTTPLYQIETDLLIKQDKQNGGGGAGDDILKSLDLFSSDKIIDNEIQILKSYTLFEKVVKDLGLQVSYFQTGRARKVPLYETVPFQAELLKPNHQSYNEYLKVKLLNNTEVEVDGKKGQINYPIQTDLGTVLITAQQVDPKFFNVQYDIKFNDLDYFYQTYSTTLSVSPVSKDGTVLIITYQDAIPKRGEDLLNRLVLEYNNAAVADKNKVASSTLNFIDERLIKLSNELGTAEQNVQNYKSTNQIADISSQSHEFMQTVQQNDADLEKINIQLAVLQNLENDVNSSDDSQEKLPSMLSIEDPTLLGI